MVSIPMIKTTDSGHPYVMGIAHECGVADCRANSAAADIDTDFFEKARHYGQRIQRGINLESDVMDHVMQYLQLTQSVNHIFETEIAFQTQGDIHG